MTPATVDVSVVVPTIGRARLLEACLASLASGDSLPSEIVVVDQSASSRETQRVVEKYADVHARRVECAGRGIPLAVNTGIEAARSDRIAVTHDDCTVAPSWVQAAASLLDEHAEALITGRVTPVGDLRAVPAVRDDPQPRVFSDWWDSWALLPNNMAARRETLIALGGFDDRFDNAGEDLDFAHRWLATGRVVRYEPEMRVWHHDWRTAAQMRRTYVSYARGCGLFYAKYLRDRRARRLIVRYLARDLLDLARAIPDLARRPQDRWWDDRLGAFPGLFVGLWEGWSLFRSR